MAQVVDTAQGFVALASGETRTLVQEPPSNRVGEDEPTSSGVIYTGRDLPSLEELLAAHEIVTAVLERPAPIVDAAVVQAARQPAPAFSTEAVILAATSGAISMAGWVLLVASVVPDPLRVNPYIALSLALGGLVLVATVAVAAKTIRRR